MNARQLNRQLKLQLGEDGQLVFRTEKRVTREIFYELVPEIQPDPWSYLKVITGILFLTHEQYGIVVDFADWKDIKFYDVKLDRMPNHVYTDPYTKSRKMKMLYSGKFLVEGDTKFSKNRSMSRLKRVFTYATEGDILQKTSLEIYKAELMFISAVYYLKKVFINYPKETRHPINRLEELLKEKWAGASDIEYVITEYCRKTDSNSLFDIALTLRPAGTYPFKVSIYKEDNYLQIYIREQTKEPKVQILENKEGIDHSDVLREYYENRGLTNEAEELEEHWYKQKEIWRKQEASPIISCNDTKKEEHRGIIGCYDDYEFISEYDYDYEF